MATQFFSSADLAGLPAPVRRHLAAAIAPGAPIITAARLDMYGQIKLGRWLPFRAREVLDLPDRAVWSARVAGLITGEDRLDDDRGAQDWRVLGMYRVLHSQGVDIARSAAGRFGAEAVWLPTALLPRFGVRWTAEADDEITAHYRAGSADIALHCRLDADGHLTAARFDRWGDPDGSGTFGLHPFTIEVSGRATFAGLTIPASGTAGWLGAGAFFRYRITRLEPAPRRRVGVSAVGT